MSAVIAVFSSSSSWPVQYWRSTSPTSLPDGQYLLESGPLGGLGWLPRLAAPPPPPPQVSALEPGPAAYLPLPALMAAFRAMTPAGANLAAAPTVCVHTHPALLPAGAEPTFGGLLAPSRDVQTPALHVLLNRLLSGTGAVGSRVPAARSPDLSFLGGLGALNPALVRTGFEEFPRPALSERELRQMADNERSAAAGRTTLMNGNPESEMFPRSVQPVSAPAQTDESHRISMLLSANGGDWANRIEQSRRRRSASRPTESDSRHQMSAALSGIIRRIGFEKYSEALQMILQDLQPLKEITNAARSHLGKAHGTYQKFENDLNNLLEQTRQAQQILFFLLSSLFQENIIMRRKLEECAASKQILTARMHFPDRSGDLDALRRQLENKMRHYDTLVIGLLRQKSALEVERRRLVDRCRVPSDPATQPDPFSLSTLLSLMTGLGEPSGAQRDINILLMRLFPDLYPEPPPPPAQTARYSHPKTGGGGGSTGGWLQVLIPLMNTDETTETLHFPVAAPSRVSLPLSYASQYVMPRVSPLRHAAAPPPSAPRADTGDQFIMNMLQLMLQLYSTQTGPADESRMKEQLVSFGRALLC